MSKKRNKKNSQEHLVKRHFESTAGDWDSIYLSSDLTSAIIQERQDYVFDLLDSLEIKTQIKVLDLGCGAGQVSLSLLERGFKVVGIDVAENMIELARNRCADTVYSADATFKVSKAESLDLLDDEFDLVVAIGLIEYLKNDRKAIQEMWRVTKPGGYIIITAPNLYRLSIITDPVWWALQGIRKVMFSILGKETTIRIINFVKTNLFGLKPSLAFERKYYVPSKLNNLITECNLEIIRSLSHGFGHFRFMRKFNQLSLKLNSWLNEFSMRRKTAFFTRLGNDYIVLCKKT